MVIFSLPFFSVRLCLPTLLKMRRTSAIWRSLSCTDESSQLVNYSSQPHRSLTTSPSWPSTGCQGAAVPFDEPHARPRRTVALEHAVRASTLFHARHRMRPDVHPSCRFFFISRVFIVYLLLSSSFFFLLSSFFHPLFSWVAASAGVRRDARSCPGTHRIGRHARGSASRRRRPKPPSLLWCRPSPPTGPDFLI